MPHYEIIIIPVEEAIASNLDADRVDRGKTSKTFTVGLSPTGKEPCTHLWCCWWVSDSEAEDLRKEFDPAQSGNKHRSKMFDCRIWQPYQILASMGLKVIQPEPILFSEPEIIYSDQISHMGMYVNL